MINFISSFYFLCWWPVAEGQQRSCWLKTSQCWEPLIAHFAFVSISNNLTNFSYELFTLPFPPAIDICSSVFLWVSWTFPVNLGACGLWLDHSGVLLQKKKIKMKVPGCADPLNAFGTLQSPKTMGLLGRFVHMPLVLAYGSCMFNFWASRKIPV